MEKPPSPSSPKHQRSSSIDNEPKTLTYEEFEKALKGALAVINTYTREEAEKIFFEEVHRRKKLRPNEESTNNLVDQGLKPVGSAVNAKLDSMVKADGDDETGNISEVKKP